MHYIYACFLLLLSTTFLAAQSDAPVDWHWSIKELGNQELEITFKATIKKGWKVYSQTLESDDGPIATSINLEVPAKGITVLSNIESTSNNSNKYTGHDDMFQMNLTYYKNDLTIVTTIKYTSAPVSGYLTYMCCDDTRCMPPRDVEFEYNGKNKDSKTITSPSIEKEVSDKVYDLKRPNIIESAKKIGLKLESNRPEFERATNQGLFSSSYLDYYTALEEARKQKKPLLVYFTGYGAVNCRKMEENIMRLPSNRKLLEEKYIIAELFVDSREKLLAPIVTSSGRKIETIGQYWATFQVENFQIQSQPYMVILNPYEEIINYPRAYTPDPVLFEDFLKEGLRKY